jgi:hypothetical protein
LPTGKAKYFSSQNWTGKIRLKCFDKFDFWRKCQGAPETRRFVTSNLFSPLYLEPDTSLSVIRTIY